MRSEFTDTEDNDDEDLYSTDEDAEDVLQEGFIRVFKSLDSFKGEGSFEGWVRKIMVNTALNYLRKHARYNREMVFNDLSEKLHSLPSTADHETPETALNALQITNLIRKMPAGYQTVFNLFGIEGYSHAEIAKMLGIQETTSRTQYLKARRLLKHYLQNETQNANKHAG